MARNLNRVLAVGMATTMLFGGAITAFATAGDTGVGIDITGAGTEVSAKTDIYQLALPTDDAIANTFKFNVDPEGLIAESKHAFGSEVTVNENNGVLFKNVNGTNVSVSGTSDKLTISNKSYKPVDVTIAVAMTEASSGGYAKGYSTTADFSTDTDKTTGLYIGFIATGIAEKPINATSKTLHSAMKSDEAEYELKATDTSSSSTTTYAYALKDASSATGTAFDLQFTAAMNRNLPMDTWQTTNGEGEVTAKAMPTISITFTPTQNKSAIGQAKWNSSWGFDFALKSGTAEDGGLAAAPTDVKWNGRAITGDIKLNDKNWATITWAQLIEAYNTDAGTTYTTSQYDDGLWKGNNVIEFKIGTQKYIAEIK